MPIELRTNMETGELILTYIRRYVKKHGYVPSQREIAGNCYISLTSAHFQLEKLERQHLITKDKGIARGYRLKD